jgi:cytochrome c-type biogenesis protein CcmE
MRTHAMKSLLVALALLACSGRSGPPRVYEVEQVVSHEAELAGEAELAVRGTVAAGSLRRDGDATRFVLAGTAGSHARLRAEIRVAPDTLRDGNNGVVTGGLTRDADGWLLHASSVVMRAGRLP